jgi:hypothetical protein
LLSLWHTVKYRDHSQERQTTVSHVFCVFPSNQTARSDTCSSCILREKVDSYYSESQKLPNESGFHSSEITTHCSRFSYKSMRKMRAVFFLSLTHRSRLASLMSFVEVVRLDWKQLKASQCVCCEAVSSFRLEISLTFAQHQSQGQLYLCRRHPNMKAGEGALTTVSCSKMRTGLKC